MVRRAPPHRETDPQVDRGALIDLHHVGAVLRRRWMILCAAMLAASVIAGVLWQYVGPSATFWAGALLAAGAAALLTLAPR